MEKNNFKSLSKNKINFMQLLALDDDLAKLMVNGNKNYKDNVVTEAQKYGLMYTQIYPFPKTTGTLTESKSYITMAFRYKRATSGNTFKVALITFHIFCNEKIVQTSYMENRQDAILQCVDRLLNESRSKEWLGKLAFDTMEDEIIDNGNGYVGIRVTYKNTEFQ